MSGLPSIFNNIVQYDDSKTLEKAIRRDMFIYNQHRGEQTFQKSQEDKKKGNMEKMKKGHKPPFFRNSSQGKPSQNDSRMSETLGKIQRKQPIKC